jgi:hypothetical protein
MKKEITIRRRGAVEPHPNAPRRLVQAFRNAGSFHKLASEIGVNIQIIHSLITRGIEPTDKTEKGREIRRKLYLTKFKKQAKPRQPLTPMQKAIRRLATATNNSVLIVRVLRKTKEFTGEQKTSSKIKNQDVSRVRTTRR